jgi:hypothetical protein
MEGKTYESPRITDFGSLEELTATCDVAGLGDIRFPGSLQHNVIDTDSQGNITCISLP